MDERNVFDLVVNSIHRRVTSDKDIVVGFTGEEGIGKSEACNATAYEYSKVANVSFDIEKNVLYNPNVKDLISNINTFPKYSPINVDEAIKLMLKDEHYTKANIFLKKVFATCRKRNQVVFACMPYFTDFVSYFRKNRIKMWVYMLDRGKGVVFTKDNVNPASVDPWNLKQFGELVNDHMGFRRKISDFSISEKLKLYQKHPNYFGYIEFPRLPDAMRNKYKELSDKVTYEIEEEAEEAKLIWKERTAVLAKLIVMNGWSSLVDISDKTGIPQPTLTEAIKSELGEGLSEMMSKEIRPVFKKTHYQPLRRRVDSPPQSI